MCAGVSALVMTYISCLDDAYKREMFSFLEKRISDGAVKISVRGFRSERDKSTVLIYTYVLTSGIKLISQSYPSNVMLL